MSSIFGELHKKCLRPSVGSRKNEKKLWMWVSKNSTVVNLIFLVSGGRSVKIS